MDKEGHLPNPVSDAATGSIQSGDSDDVKPEGIQESELLNHVDQDASAKDISSAGTMDAERQKDKNEDLKEESADQNSQDGTSETSQDKQPETEDDIEKPNFETAPNVSMDESQEDHAQALDPFDALLKDTSDTTSAERAATASQNTSTVQLDDDDDNNADAEGNHDEEAGTEGGEAGEAGEGGEAGEAGEGGEAPAAGADEEVCLLPDTEREISEADKALAARVLAEKRKQAEDEAALAVPKEEQEAGEAGEAEGARDDAEPAGGPSPENGERDADEEPVELDEALVPQVIQEISPLDAPCDQCQLEQPCSFRIGASPRYLCNEPCVKAYTADRPQLKFTVARKKYLIEEIAYKTVQCSECEETKTCYFYYNFDGEDTYYCSMGCLEGMMADEKEQYAFKRRRLTIDRVAGAAGVPGACLVCRQERACHYALVRYGERHLLCDTPCIKALNGQEGGRYFIRKAPRKAARAAPAAAPATPAATPAPTPAATPAKAPLLKLKVISNATDKYLDEGYKIQAKTPAMVQAAREERERTFLRKCAHCTLILTIDEKTLSWETMEFCDEVCLGRFQNKVGSRCANCQAGVLHTSLGKYCVRFGSDIRQFCNSGCLEEFKKGLKICCYCQRDISAGHQGFLAPVGDKGQFKDFCSPPCMERFEQMSRAAAPPPWAKCAVCSLDKAAPIEVEVGDATQRLCSDPCFAAFKFVNNVFPDQCRWCKKYFERKLNKNFTVYGDNGAAQCFCSKACMNVFVSQARHIVPCSWCKVKKYNFDMIRRAAGAPPAPGAPPPPPLMMCSLNCLNLYQVSVNAVSSRKTKCDMCKRSSLAQYHLTMSDATVRNFCTYQCVMSFQGQYSKHAPLLGEAAPAAGGEQKAVPAGAPRRTTATNSAPKPKGGAGAGAGGGAGGGARGAGLPVISNVQSLASAPPPPAATRGKKRAAQAAAAAALAQAAAAPEPPAAPRTPPPPPRPPTPPPPPPPKIYNHVIVKTLPPAQVHNKGTSARPASVSKGVSCRPHPCTKECQTDPSLERRVLIPVPVPVYVPVPCAMWSLPFPVPVPIPIPVPVPVFVPTTRNSAKGIMKEINKIHDKMPTDPFEAELLMMAEMVAGDKKKDQSDSDTDDDNAAEETFSPVGGMDGHNAFGEDMLQMALKMATEYEEQPVDLESAMTANTITPSSHPGMPGLEGEGMHQHHLMLLEQQRAVAAIRSGARGKRPPAPAPAPAAARARASKRRRAEPPAAPEPPREPQEKPDANMCLKYTFGVNAWKQWVMTKNAELESSSVRRKPFKSEILQLTADELNYSLCLFVKEVRKPNGSEYAPDTIYYLVLGIQQYLFENGRIDNIFTDPYYEKFTDCLDEVARKFSVLYNDSQYIVTRVEEEHLWESKQLGAHSPHVLLSTLMFFNTKHFNLVTVEEHMQLSFSHIMKHWKRNPNAPGQAKIPGSRNVLLRFYPPQSALEANSRKKKVYEQQENEENPLRCPVKLYEFYISKCPESVRTRNDVFYLQPERSCVPDSPVWYSTAALSRAALAKMLHRVKMVKEINIALLTS